MRHLLLKNFELALKIFSQDKISELVLGKTPQDHKFPSSYSELELFQPSILSRLKNQKIYLEFKRLENVLQFIKIKELNHSFLHIHTLELSKHAFSSNW